MNLVFYLLAALFVAVGVAWAALVFGNASAIPAGNPYAGAAIVVAAAPAVSLALSGLVFLAIGRALGHLSLIARATVDTADVMEAVARAQGVLKRK